MNAGRRLLAVFLTVAVVALQTLPAIEPASSYHAKEYGDWGKVRVTSTVAPCIDEYGRPTVNPDGTFYSNDMFKVGYIVEHDRDVSLEGISIDYDRRAFQMVESREWGGLSGSASFKVNLEAQPGVYAFGITARANKRVRFGSSGTLTVTYGGAVVNAYYKAWCRLVIKVNDQSMGSTYPTPGEYWFEKNTYVGVEAVPNEGYEFEMWLLDGTQKGTSPFIMVHMNVPHVLTAVFKATNSSSNGQDSQVANLAPPSGQQLILLGFYSGGVSQGVGGRTLRISNFTWQTWFNPLRGVVCQAKGVLTSSTGEAVAGASVTVEFLKKNVVTGAMWITQKSVVTDSRGRFTAEDTCMLFLEAFLNSIAWAEKTGFLPTWGIKMCLNKEKGVVELGGRLFFGVLVDVEGRFSEVPVSLSAENIPSGVSVSFNPQYSSAAFLRGFASMGMFIALESAQTGVFTVNIRASSGDVSDEKAFTLSVEEFKVKSTPSNIRFQASGLDADAYGLALTLDFGTEKVNVDALPYTASWNVDSTHTFQWRSEISSRVDGKKYTLDRVEAVINYIAYSNVYIQVVEYNPRFTPLLAYSILNSTSDMTNATGRSSFEKPIGFIIRYDGNGPEGNLRQRALVEGFSWDGWFMRGWDATDAPRMMNLTVGLGDMVFNAFGLDASSQNWVLMVDGSLYYYQSLPVKFKWQTGSTHTYQWNTLIQSADEAWFEPYMVVGCSNKTAGTVEATVIGGSVVALYIKYKRPLTFLPSSKRGGETFLNWTRARVYYENGSLAQAFEITNNKPVPPILFAEDMRYALLIFSTDADIIMKARSLNYTTLFLEMNFYTLRFTPQPRLVANINHTLYYEVFEQQLHVKAVKPRADGGWGVDRSVRFNVTFSVGSVSPEREVYASWFSNQTYDPVAVQIALSDIYNPTPQSVWGWGEAHTLLNKTSPHFFNVTALVGGYGKKVTVRRDNVHIPFGDSPYVIYINMFGGGVSVSVIEDRSLFATLNVTVQPEAGGASKVEVYSGGMLLYNRDFEGFIETQRGIFGFAGELNPTIIKYSGMNTKLTVRVENVWGAVTEVYVEVSPYIEPPFISLLGEIVWGMSLIIIATVIIAFILRFWRRGFKRQ